MNTQKDNRYKRGPMVADGEFQEWEVGCGFRSGSLTIQGQHESLARNNSSATTIFFNYLKFLKMI